VRCQSETNRTAVAESAAPASTSEEVREPKIRPTDSGARHCGQGVECRGSAEHGDTITTTAYAFTARSETGSVGGV